MLNSSDLRFSNTLEYFRKFGVSRDTFQVVLDQLLIGELNWERVLSMWLFQEVWRSSVLKKGKKKR